MALEDVLNKISQTALEKKNEILREANLEKEKILLEWQKKATEFYENERRKCEIEAENEKRSLILAKRLELRKELLTAKQNIINKAFNDAFEKIKALPQKDYEGFLEKQIKKYIKGDEEILCRKEDKKLIENLLKKNDKNSKISNEDVNISGGFIIRKGKIEINLSLDILFDSKKNEIELEVGKILNVF